MAATHDVMCTLHPGDTSYGACIHTYSTESMDRRTGGGGPARGAVVTRRALARVCRSRRHWRYGLRLEHHGPRMASGPFAGSPVPRRVVDCRASRLVGTVLRVPNP